MASRSVRRGQETQAALSALIVAPDAVPFVAVSRMTIADFMQPWLDGLANQGRKATTLRGYRGVLRTHVLPALGSMPLEQLQACDLDTLYASLLRSKLSMTSVHHVHAVVSKMLHDAERKGLVTRNVARLASARAGVRYRTVA